MVHQSAAKERVHSQEYHPRSAADTLLYKTVQDSLHADVAIPAKATRKIEKLLRYTARPPIAQERLSQLPNGKLVYKLKTTYSNGTTHVMFDPIELVEKLVALIPPPRANLLRYHGVLAPNAKARKHIVPAQNKDSNQKNSNRTKNRTWSELMKRVFGFDVLKCPSCGAKMKVISTLLDSAVVKPFLKSVKRTHEPPEPAPARAPPHEPAPFDYDQTPTQDPHGF